MTDAATRARLVDLSVVTVAAVGVAAAWLQVAAEGPAVATPPEPVPVAAAPTSPAAGLTPAAPVRRRVVVVRRSRAS